MSTSPATLRIDIVSDVVCPWCIIGWKRLEAALVQLADEVAAEIHWRPFELNPAMPPEGEDTVAHVARKYGRSAQEAAASRGQLIAIGEAAGFDFRWRGEGDERASMVWNSFLAHKMLAFIGGLAGWQAQHRLALRLFQAHFQQRLDISSRQTLLDIAREPLLGLGAYAQELEAALDDPALAKAVRDDQAQWADANITGVPAIILDQRFIIPGAQETDVFVDLIRKVVTKR